MARNNTKDLTVEELEELLKEKKKITTKRKNKKKKVTTGKKALIAYFAVCGILVAFTMFMIFLQRDSSALNTLAEAGLQGLPIVYGIYQANSYFINKKHMEMNYIPNYDEMGDI